MSILRYKQKLFADGGVLRSGGGSGGGGGPTTTTQVTSNIPEYARPYVENMLQSAQAQVYNDDMTSFRGYQPYSTDVNNYFAGFSPLQQQAQQSAWNLQTPSEYGLASGMAGQAGIGSLAAQENAGMLGTEALGYGQAGSMYGGMGAQQAMQAARETGAQAAGYGGMGSLYGQQAADMAQQGYGAGARFAQQATSPEATKAYMSPYMQNVVDYQKAQAARDYNIAQTQRQAQAVAKGAFGGSRQAIVDAEAQRNLMGQLQGIEATGAQEAFKNAQAQQQFGANLGLQGLQAGYQGTGMGIQGAGMGLQGVGAQQAASQLGLAGTAQGMQGAQTGLQGVGQAVGAGQYGLAGLGQATQAAGTLGNLGTQRLAADTSIIGTQSQMGAQQQALEQQKINQAIQDYATAQQYPFMQLGMMSALLRGLPLQQATTQQYQAAPSTISQLGGLAATGLGTYGAMGGFKAAGGGAIKEYAAGGNVKGYAGDEGSVVGGLDVIDKVSNELESMPTSELVKLAKTSSSDTIREKASQILAMRQVSQAQAPKKPSGIAAAPVPETMFSAAGGGIVAFDEGGSVPFAPLDDEGNVMPLTSEQKKQRAAEKIAAASTGTNKEGRADLGGFGNVQRYISGLKDMGFGQSTEEEKALRADLLKDKERAARYGEMNPWLALAMGGAKTMAGKSQYALQNIGEGFEAGLGTYAKGEKDMADMLKGIRAGEIDINKLGATERNNLLHYALTGAVSEARTAEEAKTRRQTADIAAAARAGQRADAQDLAYVTKINELTKAILANKFNPSEADVAAARKMAKQQIDNELSLGKPGRGSAAPVSGGDAVVPEGVKVKKVG